MDSAEPSLAAAQGRARAQPGSAGRVRLRAGKPCSCCPRRWRSGAFCAREALSRRPGRNPRASGHPPPQARLTTPDCPDLSDGSVEGQVRGREGSTVAFLEGDACLVHEPAHTADFTGLAPGRQPGRRPSSASQNGASPRRLWLGDALRAPLGALFPGSAPALGGPRPRVITQVCNGLVLGRGLSAAAKSNFSPTGSAPAVSVDDHYFRGLTTVMGERLESIRTEHRGAVA